MHRLLARGDSTKDLPAHQTKAELVRTRLAQWTFVLVAINTIVTVIKALI